MIPERNAVKVDSTVQGAAVAMSIDDAATVHIMNVVTDLYEDPERACIREYSTNALDAHIEAGVDRPIEVTTPTDLRPLLTIRDFGNGLTYDDIEQIYSRYGASTKRGTNDAVGMLGLGCKSALSYTDQFSVVGIVNGARIVVSVSRDETGAGTMTVLESTETDEPDGVEVIIPARRDNHFTEKAEAFFAYWEPGTVLLNGEEPDPLGGLAISDQHRVLHSGNRYDRTRELTVVMGNVPYPAPDDYEHPALNALPWGSRLIVRVPIGSVQFAPSREALQDHPATRRALDDALDGFAETARAYVQRNVNGAATRPDAARCYVEARAMLGDAPFGGEAPEWQGDPVPDAILAPDAEHPIWRCPAHRAYGYDVGGRSENQRVDFDQAVQAFWILDYTNATWNAAQRRKADAFLEREGHRVDGGASTIILYAGSEVPSAEWLGGAVDSARWEDIRDWVDPSAEPKAAGGGKKTAGTYPVYNPDYRYSLPDIDATELPTDDQLLYTTGGKYDGSGDDAAALLGLKCVRCSPNRADKFRRLFPDARPANEAARQAVAEWVDALTDVQRDALAFDWADYPLQWIARMDPAEIDDPALARAVRAAQAWDGSFVGEARRRRQWSDFTSDPGAPNPFNTYPLLTSFSGYNESPLLDSHAIVYVNAAYAARTKEEA